MNLTPQQQHAVDSESREILCVAGAGAGKTAVFANRIARLIREGEQPESFLALTFTRAAARNMRERIASLTDDGTARRIEAGTFHAVCLRVLSIYGDRLGYDIGSLEVIAPDDAEALVLEACRDLGYLSEDRSGRKKWKAGLSMQRVQSAVDASYRDPYANPPDELHRITMHYRRELKRNNCLDFGSILSETNRLFTEHGDVLERYQGRWRHVFVDEGHDLDAIQYRTHGWFAPPGTAFIVFDPRQNIYSWRGARPDICQTQYPKAETVYLPENFRCRSAIVDVANRLIAHNPEGCECEPMRAVNEGGTVKVIHGRSNDIAAWVLGAGIPGTFSPRGYNPRDIAVIARSHRELARLSSVFAEVGIPHRHVGRKFDITTTDDFRALHAAMRLACNPRDNHAFRRIAPRLGVTPGLMTELRLAAARTGKSLWPCLYEWIMAESDFNPLGNLIASREVDTWPCLRFVGEYARIVGWGGSDVVAFWAENCQGMTLAEALQWYACRDEQDELPTKDENLVSLMTAHGAKGLEYKCVVVCNLNEGTWPTGRAIREGGVEEERRAFFVACTRAEDVLLLHYRRPEDQAEERAVSEPSRFLTEMGVLS